MDGLCGAQATITKLPDSYAFPFGLSSPVIHISGLAPYRLRPF